MNSRASLPAKAWPSLARHSNALIGGLIITAGLALLLALWSDWIDILPVTSQIGSQPATEEPSAVPNTVELSAEKLAAADLHITTVQRQMVRLTRNVHGEINYDEPRRVPVHAPVEGIVLQVLADPVQEVKKGQPLAVLSCPEIGEARDAVEKRRADLALARREGQRAADIARNVDELLALLSQKPKLSDLELAQENRLLGEYREKIVGAYSRLLLAERVNEVSTRLEGGLLSIRDIEQRKAEREQEHAKFRSICETAGFAVRQERDRVQAEVEQSQRLFAVAQESLKNLLGPWAAMDEITESDRLNELKLLAPLDGRVVERLAVPNARVAARDPLFVVADTSMLWVTAEIHERDWPALNHLKQSDILDVRVPALENELFHAKISWIGAQLEVKRHSVPLVAHLSNADGRLKPGMLVWAMIPLGEPREVPVVPAGSIMRHENQPFVFVPDGERRFRRVDVELGLEANDQIEITSGLAVGDAVVDRGAFYLKSELLLEREE